MRASDVRGSLALILRAHRILNRMRIPPLTDVNIDPLDENLLSAFLDRMKRVQLYMDSLRGKYLRQKKKAVAANRALLDYQQGNKKTWQQRCYMAERRIDHAMEFFRKNHKASTHGADALENIIPYLVDRSNQLHLDDSALGKMARKEAQDATMAKNLAERKVKEQDRIIQWYATRYGYFAEDVMTMNGPTPQDMLEATVGDMARTITRDEPRKGTVADLLAEADSFPWKRGNPAYLGDYETTELLNEVDKRCAALESNLKAAKGALRKEV